MKVVALRRGDQEGVQLTAVDHGAQRVQPRATVRPNGREERQSNAELIEPPAPCGLQVRSRLSKLAPADHPAPPEEASLNASASLGHLDTSRGGVLPGTLG